jgi:hypothetical protein
LFFKTPSIDKVLTETANQVNKSCPVIIDKETRLDGVLALPDHIFQYNYTLVNKGKSEVNADTLKAYLEPRIVNNTKTNPDLKGFRDNKTTLVYNYSDKNGVFIFKITVTPDLYAEK